MYPFLLLQLLIFHNGLLLCSVKISAAENATVVVYRPVEDEIADWLVKRCSLDAPFPPGIEDGPLSLDVTLDLYHLFELSVKDEKMAILADLALQWTHPCVSWGNDSGTSHWADVTEIGIPPSRVWKPIIQHMNSASDLSSTDKLGKDITLYIYSTGLFYWNPMGRFESVCELNLVAFPFDTQYCDLWFESWEPTTRINITKVKLVFYDKHGFSDSRSDMWTLMNASASLRVMSYNGDPAEYSRAVFTLCLKRGVFFFVGSVLLPALALAVLQISTLIMEPKVTDRPCFSITVVLSLAVLMTFVSTIVPQTSQIILLSLVLSCQFFIGLIITVYTVISSTIADNKEYSKIREVWFFGRHLHIRQIRLIDITVGGVCSGITFIINVTIYSIFIDAFAKANCPVN